MCEADAGFEASDDRAGESIARGELLLRGNEGDPYFGLGSETQRRLRRHHADDGVRLPVQHDGFSYCSRIASESFVPKGIAEYDRPAAGLHVGRGKGSAD
jgi:hypothetical protein